MTAPLDLDDDVEVTAQYFEMLKEIYSWPCLCRWAVMLGLWLCRWGTESGRAAIRSRGKAK